MNRETRRKNLFAFAKEKNSYKNKLYKIIFHAEEDDISRIIKVIKCNPSMSLRMKRILFPSTIKEMCSTKIVVNMTINFDYLRKYYLAIFHEYMENISEFIELKNQYEKFLFSEKYDDALKVIDKIEEREGLSVWSISKKMFLYEKIEGLEKHKKYLSDILCQTNNYIFLNTLFELESYFAEENTSYTAYKKRIENYNDVLEENDIIRKYIDFKYNIERDYDMEELRIAFMFDSQLSLVDMYETFILAEQLNSVEGNVNKQTLNLEDFQLRNIAVINNPESILYEDSEYYHLLELYTCGKYKEYIEECYMYLIKEPQDFQCIVLLVKSYIFLDKKPDFDHEVYKWIYDVYALNGKEGDAISSLFSYLKVVRFTSWEYKIIGLISRKMTMKNRDKMSLMSTLNDLFISPNIIANKCFVGNSDEILKKFYDVCPVTQKLYIYKQGLVPFPIEISDLNRKLFFKVDNLIRLNKNDEALRLIEEVQRSDGYFLERKLKRKICIYDQKMDYLSEVKCITNAILLNGGLKNRIDILSVYKKIRQNLCKEIKKDVHYVAFVYLCMPHDYNKQRIAYSNYMDYNAYESIEDIIENETHTQVLITFLSKVCVQHLLKRDIILNPLGDKAEELRIEILKKLIEIDSNNKKKYYSEITFITKQKSIKDRIKQINQSRIFVDSENIKKDNSVALIEDFNRYLAMRNLDDEIISYDIYSVDYINDLKKIVDEMNEKIKTSPVYSQKIIILKGIITTITEEFLFNEKYGLNTFLSSRIRHGYCKNHLTSVFQEYNLLSKKIQNNSSEYLINEYWDDILPEDTQASKEIKKSLSNFTLNIEKEIEYIKKYWLSIRFKEENDGLLDYTKFVNQCLLIDMDNIVDFNTFYDEIINLLWNHTMNLFKILRRKIQGELLTFFQNELTKLLEDIGKVTDKTVKENIKLITNNINLCKTKIGGKAKEFANVFDKRDVSYLDFTMDDLIDTCLEIVTKLNSGMSEVKLERCIEDSRRYKGEYFPYFVDAVNILINNALEHSGITDLSELLLSIIVKEENDYFVIQMMKEEFERRKIRIEDSNFMSLTVSNFLSKDTDITMLEDKIKNIFDKTKDMETVKKYSQSEGGTGLYKLYKTFHYNINTPSTIFYSIEKQKFSISILFGLTKIVA